MSRNFISIFLSTFAYYDYVASVCFNYTDFGNAWLREEPLQIVSQLTHVKRIFAFICEYKHLVYVCKGRVVERQRREKRNSGCRTRSQIGRIRWIFNRRNPISPAPENGMSSFPSALSLPKIRYSANKDKNLRLRQIFASLLCHAAISLFLCLGDAGQ